jgi:putative membrane protein
MTVNVEQLLLNLLLAAVFSVLGFVLLFVGYKVLDWVTPEDMGGKIFREGNTAVAILAAGFVIGLSIIIAASVQG